MQAIFRRLKAGMLSLLIVATVTAQVPTELEQAFFTGDLFARSSVDFRKSNRQNIQGVVPKGSTGTVLETKKLRSGAYAVRLRVDSVPKSLKPIKEAIKPPEEAWVYFAQDDPWLAFKDKEGTEVQDPELALEAQAKKDGQGLRHPASLNAGAKKDPQSYATQADARRVEAGICDGCTIPAPTNQPTRRNQSDLSQIASAAIPGPTEVSEVVLPGTTSTSDNAQAENKRTRTEAEVKAFSESQGVQQMITHAMRSKAPSSKRLCYRYVKKSLLAGKLVSTYPPGARAKDAVVDLKAQGMVNLLDDPQWKKKITGPKDAPKGAVLVYSHSSKRRAGHIEIKTGEGTSGGYVSDFYQSTPILGNANAGIASRRYQLIGVFVK